MDVVPGAGDGSGDVRVDGHLHTGQLVEFSAGNRAAKGRSRQGP